MLKAKMLTVVNSYVLLTMTIVNKRESIWTHDNISWLRHTPWFGSFMVKFYVNIGAPEISRILLVLLKV